MDKCVHQWGGIYIHPSCRFTKDDPNKPIGENLYRNFYDNI